MAERKVATICEMVVDRAKNCVKGRRSQKNGRRHRLLRKKNFERKNNSESEGKCDRGNFSKCNFLSFGLRWVMRSFLGEAASTASCGYLFCEKRDNQNKKATEGDRD